MKRNIDLDWYEKKAESLLRSKKPIASGEFLESIETRYRRPFVHYYKLILANIREGSKVLEIGSGTGDHTKIILDTNANLTALDISINSLKVLQLRYPNVARTVTGNMENMPFLDEEFDAVVTCGSLSYGNPRLVLSEIYRVLKPGGKVIILDTLASNPIFMLLRFRHVLLKRRSLKTLLYMPGRKTVKLLTTTYKNSSLAYFDPLVTILSNSSFGRGKSILYAFDKFLALLNQGLENSRLKFLAHKFTFVGTKDLD
jgi:ubiquinone/menaquinone biosynthesis C-methylase UbiE